MTVDIDAWLADAKPPQADIEVCLAGDLTARYLEKLAELAAVRGDDNRALEDQRAIDLAAEADAIKDEMQAATRTLTVRAMDPHEYHRLRYQHIPRDGDVLDMASGVNYDTFMPALIGASIVAVDGQPATFTDAQVGTLRSSVGAATWDRLANSATALNQTEVSVPKLSLGSVLTQISDAQPSKPARSASRSNGSKAGSRARSRSRTKKAT